MTLMGYGLGMMGLGWLWFVLTILLISLIVYAVVKLANRSDSKKYNDRYEETRKAIGILNRKFANGEISEDEYKRKRDLMKQ